MALFILCSKFHLKSARNKDPWHWAFHGIVYCPIMYLDKQKGTLTTLAEEVLNVPIWQEETGGYKPRMCWLEEEARLACLPHTSLLQLHVRILPLVYHYQKTGKHKIREVPKEWNFWLFHSLYMRVESGVQDSDTDLLLTYLNHSNKGM